MYRGTRTVLQSLDDTFYIPFFNFILDIMSVLLIVFVCLFWVAVGLDLGPTLREVCAANRSDEKQVIHLDDVWTLSLLLLSLKFFHLDG